MIRVLFVDDDKKLQEIYSTLFPIQDIHLVAQAYDGHQAVDLYASMSEKPDVVLMDQRMPRMDGITATNKILEIDPDAKVIFLSADDATESRAMNVGASMFLAKPVSMHWLVDSIKNVMSGST